MTDDTSSSRPHERLILLAAVAGLLFGTITAPARAAQRPPALRWGGDAAGGAPYIFGPPERRVGFEVELAEYLGGRLGRTPEFVQGDWDAIPDALERGNVDIALNGYEYLPDNEAKLPSTIPYYIFTLRLIVRANERSINSWDDLRNRPGGRKPRVGVLRSSVAQRYMQAKFGRDVEVIPTREVDETFQLVEGGERLDATVQDSPTAIYYTRRDPAKLRMVGEPQAPGYYVILTRPEDQELRQQLNAAIREGLRSGKLEAIYRKYHLWDDQQPRLLQLAGRPWPPSGSDAPEPLDSMVSLSQLTKDLVKATGMTIALACCSMPLAILIGIAVAIGRLYGPGLVRAPLALYVEVLRGTPLLLQIFALFFLLPQVAGWLGWKPLVWLTTLPPFVVGVFGLALNYSAYEAENYRAGLLAIPRGQMEAALALGMSRWSALRHVILPQAIRLVIPPVTNDFIALFKDTSICSMILITELTGLYYQNKYNRELGLRLALVIALFYLAMSYPLSVLARRLEKRLQRPGEEAKA
jgi:polar amino acid transport system substrate-binding protein